MASTDAAIWTNENAAIHIGTNANNTISAMADGSVKVWQDLNALGNISANQFFGDGSGLTNLPNTSGWETGAATTYTLLPQVGLGTDMPNHQLHLYGHDSVVMQMTTIGSGQDVGDGLVFSLDSAGSAKIMSNTNFDLQLGIDNNPMLVLNDFGSIDMIADLFVVGKTQTLANAPGQAAAFVQNSSSGKSVELATGSNAVLTDGTVKIESGELSVSQDGSGSLTIAHSLSDAFIRNWADGGDILFSTYDGELFPQGRMKIFANGQVAIGPTATVADGYLLNVEGKIIAEEVKVQLTGNWPDYVFEDNYELMPISELEYNIAKNKHLPGIPSAEQVENGGLSLGEMQTMMMEKIEELTLYIIQQNKRIEQLETNQSK